MIGTIGFAVDSSVLLFLVHIEEFGITVSRLCSFFLAVLATWILNRYFTFSDSQVNIKKSKEYFQYLSIQIIGAMINFSIFFILIYSFEFFKNMLILPLAIGAFFSLIFNYLVIKKRIYYRK